MTPTSNAIAAALETAKRSGVNQERNTWASSGPNMGSISQLDRYPSIPIERLPRLLDNLARSVMAGLFLVAEDGRSASTAMALNPLTPPPGILGH